MQTNYLHTGNGSDISLGFALSMGIFAVGMVITLSFFGLSLWFSIKNTIKMVPNTQSTRRTVLVVVAVIGSFSLGFFILLFERVAAYTNLFAALFAMFCWAVFHRVSYGLRMQLKATASGDIPSPDRLRIMELQRMSTKLFIVLDVFGMNAIAFAIVWIVGRKTDNSFLLRYINAVLMTNQIVILVSLIVVLTVSLSKLFQSRITSITKQEGNTQAIVVFPTSKPQQKRKTEDGESDTTLQQDGKGNVTESDMGL